MITLLWKDYRVNRQPLGLGLALLLGPFLVFILRNFYTAWRYDVTMWWSIYWTMTCATSLALSLITIAWLAGNAVAGERVDRSAEFLGYLPPSRKAIITSKALLAVGAGLIIWLVNLAVLHGVVPYASSPPPEYTGVGDDPDGVMPVLAAMSVLIFGVAWLASCVLSRPGNATGLGVLSPIALGAVVGAFDHYVGLPGDHSAGWWFQMLSFVLGGTAFVGGVVYFVRRIEP